MKRLITIIFIFFVSLTVHAQLKTISGKVLNEQNEPLPGVTIKATGTNALSITNNSGNFSVQVPEATKTLTFSLLSYESQTLDLAGKNTLTVTLKSSTISLNEVIAVGYGTQTKANLTGAVTSVSVKEVEGRALTSADQILQGKISGVSIVQNSGRPGDDNSEIRIRGVSSIDNNNEPLVIINGVQGNINDVNPNDIESISVLKDAASASIYGSRASAGVIIIETKKGTIGKGLQVDYNVIGAMAAATRLPQTVDSYTYALLINEARANVALTPIYTQTQLDLFQNQTNPNYPNTNWYDEYYKKSYMQNHYLSFRGGEKNFRFSNSLGYKKQEGILIGTSSERFTFNGNLTGNFLKNKLRFNLGLIGYSEAGKELISSTATVLAEISTSLPTAYVRSVDPVTGEPNLYSYPGRFLGAYDLGGGIANKSNNVNARASVEIEPIKNLIGKVLISNNKLKTDYVNFTPQFFTSGTYEETSIKENQVWKKEIRKAT